MATDLEKAQARQANLAAVIAAAANITTVAATLKTAVATYKDALGVHAACPGTDTSGLRSVGDGPSGFRALVNSMNLDALFGGAGSSGPSFSTAIAQAARLSGLDEALLAGNAAVVAAISRPGGYASTIVPPAPIPAPVD